jgi:hypothetical protein
MKAVSEIPEREKTKRNVSDVQNGTTACLSQAKACGSQANEGAA